MVPSQICTNQGMYFHKWTWIYLYISVCPCLWLKSSSEYDILTGNVEILEKNEQLWNRPIKYRYILTVRFWNWWFIET